MTWKELSAAIAGIPATQQDELATVWPPSACPAAKPVPIVSLGNWNITKVMTTAPFTLTTGKNPNAIQAETD